MIELLAVQAITTLALAFFIIKLRRELWPAIATAGPAYASFWIRSVDVLAIETPQFEASRVVIKVRWLLTEELHLTHSLRVYDVAMDPISRNFYREWKEWLSGNNRYRCLVEKPRGLSKIYCKAIEVTCYDMENERSRKFWEVIEIATRRKRKA